MTASSCPRWMRRPSNSRVARSASQKTQRTGTAAVGDGGFDMRQRMPRGTVAAVAGASLVCRFRRRQANPRLGLEVLLSMRVAGTIGRAFCRQRVMRASLVCRELRDAWRRPRSRCDAAGSRSSGRACADPRCPTVAAASPSAPWLSPRVTRHAPTWPNPSIHALLGTTLATLERPPSGESAVKNRPSLPSRCGSFVAFALAFPSTRRWCRTAPTDRLDR